MNKVLKVVLVVAGVGTAFYLGRLAYIKFAYPSQDKAKASDIKPAGTEATPNPSV